MADLRDIRGSQSGRNWTQTPDPAPKLFPTEYEYSPGFGLSDLARAAYEPTADVTPVVGEARAAQRGWEYAGQAVDAAKQGNIFDAIGYGLGSTGEYVTAVPGVHEGLALAKMSAKGLMGLAGTIVGPSAKSFMKTMRDANRAGTNPMQTQEMAETLLAEGMPARQVTQQTGYYKDRFGNWKTQVDDIGSGPTKAVGPIFKNWKPSQKLNEGGQWPERQLEKVFFHPKLYDEYPWLKGDNVKVRFSTETDFAAAQMTLDAKTGRVVGGTIYLNPQGVQAWKDRFGLENMNEAYRSMMLHEVQHVVQGIDNLPSGSSEDWFKSIVKQEPVIRKEINSLTAQIRQLPDTVPLKQQKIDRRDALQRHIDFMEANKGKHAHLKYVVTQGEMDAQWTQANRDVANVKYRHPIQEDRGATYQDEGTRQVKFQEENVALTSPAYGVTGTRPDTRPMSMLSPAEQKAASAEVPWTKGQDFSDILAGVRPMEQEARFGAKPQRVSNLWHGTGSASAKKDILTEGFTRGRSAELQLPGTSTSRDPLVSQKLFAYDDQSQMLKADYTGELKDIRNLRPSEYYRGVTAEPGSLYQKPQTSFHEAELFGVRGERIRKLEGDEVSNAFEKAKEARAKADALRAEVDDISRQRAIVRRQRDLAFQEYSEAQQKSAEYGWLGKQVPEELQKKVDAGHEQLKLWEQEDNRLNKVWNDKFEAFDDLDIEAKNMEKVAKSGQTTETIFPPYKARNLTENEQEYLYNQNELHEAVLGSINDMQTIIREMRFIDEPTQMQQFAGRRAMQNLFSNMNSMKANSGFYERLLARREFADPFGSSAAWADEMNMYNLFSMDEMESMLRKLGYKRKDVSVMKLKAQFAQAEWGEFESNKHHFHNLANKLREPSMIRDYMKLGGRRHNEMKKDYEAWLEAEGKNDNYENLKTFGDKWLGESYEAKVLDHSYRKYKKQRNAFMEAASKMTTAYNQ